MEIILLIIGLIIGFLAAWFIAKLKFTHSKGVAIEMIEERYISKELFENERKENDAKNRELIELREKAIRLETENKHLQGSIEKNQQELVEQQKTLRTEFTNLAQNILEEKSKKFIELNEEKVGNILNPLREKIKDFEKKVDDNYKEETRERISLKHELKHIIELNQQVSLDANRLTNALKGDKKLLGNWGEMQLEMILEKSGLEDGIHFTKQAHLHNEEGSARKPDFIINLPESKNIIIDAKASLVAYENYHNTENQDEKAKFLKEHIKALHNHIDGLGEKSYEQLYGINSPDYVLLFVAIEPALMIAFKEDASLYEKAWKKNIVLVSGSTLLATLRTISYIWKQENQKKNVAEIAYESGKLYDKFIGFIEDLQDIEKSLNNSQKAYGSAWNKLTESSKKRDTIIGRMEYIKKLGAETNKELPQNLKDIIIEE